MSEIISMLNASTGEAAEKVRTLLRSRSGDGRLFRYYVRTFGCQQNEADSEKLAGLAELMGYVRTEEPDAADLIIVNTCAVREHAERKTLSIIGQYKHIKENNSLKKSPTLLSPSYCQPLVCPLYL